MMNEDAQRLRDLIADVGLSQRSAAKEIDVKDRVMRYWCAGTTPVPRVVMLAIEHLRCLRGELGKGVKPPAGKNE
jgi:hypothetical protein